jgi:E3 ubiquitin-protein ligase RNF115/126
VEQVPEVEQPRPSADRQDSNEDENAYTASPFVRLMQQLMTQRNPTTSTSGGASASPTANEDNTDPLSGFFNQLLANLSEGTRVHIQIGGGNGDGAFQALHGNFGDYAWGEGGIDQVVTQLLNQFEGGTAEVVRADDLKNIPMTKVTEDQAKNGAQCTTCMEVFEANESVAELNCHHIFHLPCIEPWLKRHNTCPICRQSVDPSQWPKKSPQPTPKPAPNAEFAIDELD